MLDLPNLKNLVNLPPQYQASKILLNPSKSFKILQILIQFIRMKIGIIGAGAMGSGIAQVVATAGNDVVLYDVNDIARQQAVENIRKSSQKLAERGKITFAQASATVARIRTTDRLDGLGGCALVIEAILEDLEVKKMVFAELEMYVSEDAILATNTSSLSVTAIAAACQRPERVVGIHFFNPATLMPLVEVIAPLQAPPQYFTEKIVKIVENWGKTVVIARDTPGFIVNRIARPLWRGVANFGGRHCRRGDD